MNPFARALKLALTYRLNVLGCILTSVAVALLWGGNLTAVFPLVDVIMNDSSLPKWIDLKIAESNREVTENKHWLAQLDQFESEQPAEIKHQIQAEIKLRRAELAAHVQDSAGEWNDVQIAEKTRLQHFIVQLEKIEKLPPDELAYNIHSEADDAREKIADYQKRAGRLAWIAPAAHRWLPTTPFSTLVLICFAVLIGTLLKGVFRIWNQVLVARLGNTVAHDLRMQFYAHVLRLDLASFTERGRGDLMNRCTSDLSAVSNGVQRAFGQAMLEPLKTIVCFVIAAYVSWQLLLLTIVIAPVAGYTIHWLGKALKRTHRYVMQELSSIFETLTETLSGIKLIKAFTMESAEQKRFRVSSNELFRRQMKIAAYNSLVGPVTETLGLAMVLLAALMGGYLVLAQQTHIFGIKISDLPLTHGEMSLFFAMLAGMSDPARRLSNEFSFIQNAVASSERVYEVLDRQPTIVDPPQPKPLPRLTKALRFEGINFHYHVDKQVLYDINLEVRAGETLAMVGPNGCGKTTLIQLLPRFYDPQTGRITIDGVDIRDVRLQELRWRFGIVTQEILLFNDTVANNIAYGATDASEAVIEAAARKAHAHAFILDKLPNGYQTLVGPGGNRLSGGQRQRIALARAILRDPEILILDEATSQIDVESEQLIHQVLDTFTRDRTTILITHRPSTLALADRVVVMDQGRILDVGTPNELGDRCDLYRRLCHSGYRESA
jgi:ATP-binding cassette, subfamily B, bacterial MsbA